MTKLPARQRIAIIGSGISGLGAAWSLSPTHDVTLFEKDARLGGHANTVDVDYEGKRIAVDTGFIVYNELNYPNLTALFAQLGVATEASNMGFSVSLDQGRLEWSGESLKTLFAQRRNLLKLNFHAMWIDILRFNSFARRDLANGAASGQSLGAWLDARKLGKAFRENYLLPMGAAIWSTPASEMLAFPAESFLSFFANHKLIDFDRPQWRTVTGGSREYVAKLTAALPLRIATATPVKAVTRGEKTVRVALEGHTEEFDRIIFACHSDQALRLLTDATPDEHALLGAVRYAPNTAWLHRDTTLMPRRRKVWAAWNYLRRTGADEGAPVAVSYWMNRLQNLDPSRPLFVTLNPAEPPLPRLTFARFEYDHPQFDQNALNAQQRLSSLQGQRNSWYCGAWCGHGFHEDGLTAGLEVARALGGRVLPHGIARPRIFAAHSVAMAEAAE